MSDNREDLDGAVHAVSLEEAMSWTADWQKIINPNKGKPYPKSYTFDKIDFEEILKQDGVRYVRIYPAMKSDGSVTMLAVGANSDNADIIHMGSDASGIYDFATPCPNTCGESPLNHSREEE
ncbi:MAG: hypothetical protein HWE22_00810 [Flavobacteriales bacterium]|nr:hypothetical protein [Flavobacteriales bacterium]PIE86851.1 MAG: hypothetical protein CSA03_03040 [Bacteroidota bacterium]